jgi:hypothetical protein
MKLSKSSIDALTPFHSWNDHFIVVPPNRFVVFGEGKDASLRSLTVSGFLRDSVDVPMAVAFSSLVAAELADAPTKFNPLKKVGFLDDLTEAPVVAEFLLTSKQLQVLKKTDARHFTHVRFFRKTGMFLRARVFDARKYFSSTISDDSVADYAEYELRQEMGNPFYFYMTTTAFKCLPKDDYQVQVLDNEIIQFNGSETGLTFLTRDQRLGQKLEMRLASLQDTDEIYFTDPSRMTPGKTDWKEPKFQRK